MKGSGHLGHGGGGPFSLSSNLSPLAPPFTVDSSFPRPMHNSVGHQPETQLHEPYYGGDDAHYSWLHVNPPTYIPNSFPDSNPIPNHNPSPSPVSNPIRAAGISSTSAYGQSMNNFLSSQSVSRPYHPQYSPVSIQDSSTSSLDVKECGNMVPTSDFTPTSTVGGVWNNKSGSEQWKPKNVRVEAPPSYASLVNQGISAADHMSAYDEPSNIWVGKSVDSLAPKSYVGCQSTLSPVGIQPSTLVESSKELPFDMSRKAVSNPAPLQEMSCYQAPSLDLGVEPWSLISPRMASYGGYFTGFDSYKADPLGFYPASTKSSVDPVYIAPSVYGNSSTRMNRTMSANMTHIEHPRNACERKRVSATHSPSKTSFNQVNDESSHAHGDTSSLKDRVEEYSLDSVYIAPSLYGNSTRSLNRTISANMTPIERPWDACERKGVSASHNPSKTSYIQVNAESSAGHGDTSSLQDGVEESSLDPVYIAPSIYGNSTRTMSRTISANMTPIERPWVACERKGVSASHNSSKTSCTQVNVESNTGHGNRSSLKYGVEASDRACGDPSMLNDIVSLERSPLVSLDPLKSLFKAKNKVQALDVDLSGTSITPETGVGDSFECSSEVVEQFNPGVDSPCWRGALDSQYSLFGAADVVTPQTSTKISEGSNSLKLQEGPQNHPINCDEGAAICSPDLQRNGKCFMEDDLSSFLKQPSPIASLLPSGDNWPNTVEVGPSHLKMNDENVIQFSIHGNPDGGSDLECSHTNKISFHESNAASGQEICEGRISDPGIDVKDCARVGPSHVPYHVSEHYSSLPSSSDTRDHVPTDISLTEPLLQEFNTFTASQLSQVPVQTVVNSMHNVSELLVSYCFKHEGALKEQDYVVLQQVVQNLEAIIDKGTLAARSQDRFSNQNACNGKKNPTVFSTKEHDPPSLALPSGDPEFEQDYMTKGIKKILDENFNDDEEPDVQSLLYKNLWLEAEAALCSIKYKSRFARIKIEMEKFKHQRAKGESIDVENLRSPKATLEDNSDDTLAETSSAESVDSEDPKVLQPNPNQDGHSSTMAEDGHSSVMAEDVDSSVMARFRILKSRINDTVPNNKQACVSVDGGCSNVGSGNVEDIVLKPQQPVVVNLGFGERTNPWPFIRAEPEVNFNLDHYSVQYRNSPASSYLYGGEEHNSVEFGAMQSAATNILVDRLSAGDTDSPSSDWEHVLKEATWPA